MHGTRPTQYLIGGDEAIEVIVDETAPFLWVGGERRDAMAKRVSGRFIARYDQHEEVIAELCVGERFAIGHPHRKRGGHINLWRRCAVVAELAPKLESFERGRMTKGKHASLFERYSFDERVNEIRVVGADQRVAPADHVVASVVRNAEQTAQRKNRELFG